MPSVITSSENCNDQIGIIKGIVFSRCFSNKITADLRMISLIIERTAIKLYDTSTTISLYSSNFIDFYELSDIKY